VPQGVGVQLPPSALGKCQKSDISIN